MHHFHKNHKGGDYIASFLLPGFSYTREYDNLSNMERDLMLNNEGLV